MSKADKDRTPDNPQLSLLGGPDTQEGSLSGLTLQLRTVLAQAIRRSGRSRYDIAGHISGLLDRDLSKDMLDRYTAESAVDHRVPADVLAAACLALEDTGAMQTLSMAIGGYYVGHHEARELEITRLSMEIDRLREQVKELKKQP
jgi:hypothetical protein